MSCFLHFVALERINHGIRGEAIDVYLIRLCQGATVDTHDHSPFVAAQLVQETIVINKITQPAKSIAYGSGGFWVIPQFWWDAETTGRSRGTASIGVGERLLQAAGEMLKAVRYRDATPSDNP